MFYVLAWHLKGSVNAFLIPFCLFLLFIFPRVFNYLITPGPDVGTMAFFTSGMLLFITSLTNANLTPKQQLALSISSGFLLGISALFRYHALVASVFFLFSCLMGFWCHRKNILFSVITLSMVYLPQILVNILTGHGPLETYHAINIFNLVHGVDWFHMDKLMPLPSASSIIRGAPLLFAINYIRWLIDLGVFAIPPFFYGIITTGNKEKRCGFCVGIFCLLYALFFAISASPRAVLLIIPISMLFFVKILFSSETPLLLKRLALTVTLLFSPFFAYKDIQYILHSKAERAVLQSIENFFISNDIKSAQEVYTCDYDIYFVSLFPYRPLFNGGWGRIATYNYSSFYPELAVTSLQNFYTDCIRLGVKYVVLNELASDLAAFLGDLYNGSILDNRYKLSFEIGGRKIYRIVAQE